MISIKIMENVLRLSEGYENLEFVKEYEECDDIPMDWYHGGKYITKFLIISSNN